MALQDFELAKATINEGRHDHPERAHIAENMNECPYDMHACM